MKYRISILWLLFSLCLSAQDTQKFVAFGSNPTQGHKKIIEDIAKATTFDETYTATQKLLDYHKMVGNTDSVIVYGKALYRQLNNHPNHKRFAETANYIAEANINKGLFDDALQWYLKGVDHANKQTDKNYYYANNIGVALSKYIKGKNEESKEIIQECIHKTTDLKIKNKAYFYYGHILFSENNTKEAQKYLNKALAYYTKTKARKDALKTELILARILEHNRQEQEALTSYLTIYNTAFQNNFFDLYVTSAVDIGRIFTKKQDYDNAGKILHTTYVNAMEWENLEAQKKTMEALLSVFLKSEDYSNAYAISSRLRRLDEDIADNQNKAYVDELEIKYDTLKQEQELKNQRLQKQYLLIGFIIILIPLIALFYTYYQKLQAQSALNKTMKQVNDEKIATLLKTQELELIKATVEGEEKERNRIAQELHDSIGGNLASIKMQLSSDNQKHIIKQVDETYHQVRDLSHNLTTEKIRKNSFSQLLSAYVQNIKKASKQEIYLELYPEWAINALDNTLKTELFKIIQELITNTLKHANAKEITIQLTKLEDSLKLLYEDDGIGFDTHNIQEGIGLKNIKERLKTIDGTLHIDSHKYRGTIIDIDVSLT
ncbi:MAG: hypothetical protein CR968_04745 [Flavobacteriia bacterium]|nr:MAG: hypothetical protein CR968_04745 [Flavobacteriia bacterium]